MNHQLPPDVDKRVKAQVQNGNFASEDDVLREAMDTLEKRQLGLEQMRTMVLEADIDIAEGRVGVFDVDETMAGIEKRTADRDPTSR